MDYSNILFKTRPKHNKMRMEKLVQNGLINENIPKHLQLVLKKPTGESRQNSVIIVVKNITS